MQEDSNLVVEDINSHKPHNNASLVVPTVETTKTVSPRNLPVCPVDEHRWTDGLNNKASGAVTQISGILYPFVERPLASHESSAMQMNNTVTHGQMKIVEESQNTCMGMPSI